MTTESKFASLARAALGLSGDMIDSLSPQAHAGIEQALQGGASLALEFGPLPAFAAARLVLVEREGQRHTLATVEVKGRPQ